MKSNLILLLFIGNCLLQASNLLAADQTGTNLVINNSGNTLIEDNQDAFNQVVQNSGNTLIGQNRGGLSQVFQNSGNAKLGINQYGINRVVSNSGNAAVGNNFKVVQGVTSNNGNVRLGTLDGATKPYELIEIKSGNNYLITIGGLNNYVITGPSLEQTGIKTVSVNGANAVLITDTCQASSQSTYQLSSAVKEVKARLEGGSGESSSSDSGQCVSRFIKQSGWSSATNCASTSLNNFNDLSYQIINANHFTVSKSSLPNNLLRVFVLGDVVVLIDNSLQVSAKPMRCLSSQEHHLIDKLHSEVYQAEIKVQQQMTKMADTVNRQQEI